MRGNPGFGCSEFWIASSPFGLLAMTAVLRTTNAIAGDQALDPDCGPSHQRQPRRRVLESAQGDRAVTKCERCRTDRVDRRCAPRRQSVLRHPRLRAGLLSGAVM